MDEEEEERTVPNGAFFPSRRWFAAAAVVWPLKSNSSRFSCDLAI